ncbi:MAG: DUF2505 domain-containing protein [Candidatus Nanopelagicales bacterium]
MATDFTATVHLPTDVAGGFALITDKAYLDWKQQQMHAREIRNTITVAGDATTIVADRQFPAELPSAAKAVVGETISISEKTVWGPAAEDGTRTGILDVSFGGAPMALAGIIELVPAGEVSELRITVTAKCSIPFVGGKLESIAGEQFLRAVKQEEKLAPKWLAR